MIPVSVHTCVRDCGGRLSDDSYEAGEYAGADLPTVTAVTTDTRTIEPGSLFVAIKGTRVDGSTLALKALEAGAVAVVTADAAVARATGAPAHAIIEVDDVEHALGRLARANLARMRAANPDLTVVAVTGSVGKTTTKDLLSAALPGPVIAPPGSLNNEIGLPLTVLRADATTRTLLLEMGADHVGNLSYLTSIAAPDVAIVLAVARAHLGEFGGIENVARAKQELVEGTLPSGTVILNLDDRRVATMAHAAPGPVLFFSASGDTTADYYARDIELDDDGRARFTAVTPDGEASLHLHLIGAHHVANALAALAGAIGGGASLDAAATALNSSGAQSPHRMDVRTIGAGTLIDDSYNANPDSMRAGIRALAHLAHGRPAVAVLGEMLEMGEYAADEHAAIGQALAQSHISVVRAVNPDPHTEAPALRALIASAAEHGIDAQIVTPEIALEESRAYLAQGATLLVKGSHSSGVWKIADELMSQAPAEGEK